MDLPHSRVGLGPPKFTSEKVQAPQAIFTHRIVNIDFYSAVPRKEFDAVYSDFRLKEVSKVPVLRIFGATPKGQKTCAHVHGVLPYITILNDPAESNLAQRIAIGIDEAINEFLGSGSKTWTERNRTVQQHVFLVSKIVGKTFYGYRSKDEIFLRIYFYNPLIIKKAVDLLLNGAILGKTFQPYEAHIPYVLQFMIDFNLYGMNLIHYSNVKFRRKTEDRIECSSAPIQPSPISACGVTTYWHTFTLTDELLGPVGLAKTSTCELEIDVLASDIVILPNAGVRSCNPGIDAIWQDEMERRKFFDGPEWSQLSIPESQNRPIPQKLHSTEASFRKIFEQKLFSLEKMAQEEAPAEDLEGIVLSSQVVSHVPQRDQTNLYQDDVTIQEDVQDEDDELLQLLLEFKKEKESLEKPADEQSVVPDNSWWLNEPAEDDVDYDDEVENNQGTDEWEQSFLSNTIISEMLQEIEEIGDETNNSVTSDETGHIEEVDNLEVSPKSPIFQGDGQGDVSDSSSDELESVSVRRKLYHRNSRSTPNKSRDLDPPSMEASSDKSSKSSNRLSLATRRNISAQLEASEKAHGSTRKQTTVEKVKSASLPRLNKTTVPAPKTASPNKKKAIGKTTNLDHSTKQKSKDQSKQNYSKIVAKLPNEKPFSTGLIQRTSLRNTPKKLSAVTNESTNPSISTKTIPTAAVSASPGRNKKTKLQCNDVEILTPVSHKKPTKLDLMYPHLVIEIEKVTLNPKKMPLPCVKLVNCDTLLKHGPFIIVDGKKVKVNCSTAEPSLDNNTNSLNAQVLDVQPLTKINEPINVVENNPDSTTISKNVRNLKRKAGGNTDTIEVEPVENKANELKTAAAITPKLIKTRKRFPKVTTTSSKLKIRKNQRLPHPDLPSSDDTMDISPIVEPENRIKKNPASKLRELKIRLTPINLVSDTHQNTSISAIPNVVVDAFVNEVVERDTSDISPRSPIGFTEEVNNVNPFDNNGQFLSIGVQVGDSLPKKLVSSSTQTDENLDIGHQCHCRSPIIDRIEKRMDELVESQRVKGYGSLSALNVSVQRQNNEKSEYISELSSNKILASYMRVSEGHNDPKKSSSGVVLVSSKINSPEKTGAISQSSRRLSYSPEKKNSSSTYFKSMVRKRKCSWPKLEDSHTNREAAAAANSTGDLSVNSIYEFSSPSVYPAAVTPLFRIPPQKRGSLFQIKRSVSKSRAKYRQYKKAADFKEANLHAPDIFRYEYEPLKQPPMYKSTLKHLQNDKKAVVSDMNNRADVSVDVDKNNCDDEIENFSDDEVQEPVRKCFGENSPDEDEDICSWNNTSVLSTSVGKPALRNTQYNSNTPANVKSSSAGGTPRSILRQSTQRRKGEAARRSIRWDDDNETPPKERFLQSTAVENIPTMSNNSLLSKALNASEIDGPSPKNQFGFAHDMSNLQDAKAINQHQYLTIMSLEVHCQTREELFPDPAVDALNAIFLYVSNDVPSHYSRPKALYKCLLTHPVVPKTGSCAGDCSYFRSESDLIDGFFKVFHEWDPDVLVGYEIEKSSWGYIIQRGIYLGLEMTTLLSRILPSKRPYIQKETLTWDGMICGRIVLNIWKLLRHEITVQSYTYENATYHILHRKVHKFDFETLSAFWSDSKNRGRVISYYKERVVGVMQIIEMLDLVNRTSELARLFGIQFYEVFSRGSQFRVESMMIRAAKASNFVAVSPGIAQRAKMRAPEFVPLILEPQSSYYTDPVAVLDFQSLYPSMIIAYNYDYSTVIGRVEHLDKQGSFELGCLDSSVSSIDLYALKDHIHISPAGVAFVDASIRKGILPEMLEQILDTRQMVKRSMKKWKNQGATIQKILDSRQLGLKLIANVTYGYTSANFSGRMPCIEIADSVVSKGRETLQRAIDLVKSNSSRWGAEVIYGDTDSMFVKFPGRSRQEAFRLAQEIADEVTQANPKPVKLKLEKIYQPCILQSKKRYVGFSYESSDQVQPTYDAKGIETVRRDGCPAVKKILEKTLHILFTTNDSEKVKNFVQFQFKKLFMGRVSMKEYTFARQFRGREGYKPGACVPSMEIAKRLTEKDPRAEPLTKERVPYVVVYGKPTLPLIQLVRTPFEFATDYTMRLNAHYYIEKAIIPALNRCLSLAKMDVTEWYKTLPRKYLRNILEENAIGQGTLDDFIQHANCFRCDNKTEKGVCLTCDSDVRTTSSFLIQKACDISTKLESSRQICENCSGDDDSCINTDCAVFHKLLRYERDGHYHRQLVTKLKDIEWC